MKENKKKSLKEFLDKDLVFYIEDTIKKDHLFEFVFNKIEDIYPEIKPIEALKESILKKEKEIPNITAIGNYLAIPHGIFFDYSYSKEIILVAVFIKGGVEDYISEFDDREVKFLFLIGYNQDAYCTKRTEILPLITSIFMEENNINYLLKSESSEDFYNRLIELCSQ